MALSWRYGRLAVLVLVAGAVAMGVKLLGPPEARADSDTLSIQLMGPAYRGDDPYYIARLKSPGDGSTWPQGFDCNASAFLDDHPWDGTVDTVFVWSSGIGAMVNPTRTPGGTMPISRT